MMLLLWWVSWGLAGYVWLMVFRLIESKGKFPKSNLAGYARGFLLCLALGPLNFALLTYLILQRALR